MTKYLEEIKKLIDDEIEAIEGYDHAILLFNGSPFIAKLQEIKSDELEHIRELREIRDKIDNESFDPDEEGDID